MPERRAAIVNGVQRVLPFEGFTLADLLLDMRLEGKRIAVEINGSVVPKSAHASRVLRDGDRVEIVGAVGGG